MKYYKIISIEPSSNRMKRLVSDMVYIEKLMVGLSALLVYVDENLEPSYGKMMRTSLVENFRVNDETLMIKTLNNVYTLRELVA